MPRRRLIAPHFWEDSRVKALLLPERLFLVGMISHADDEGRLLADPAYLRSKIFPYDDFTLEEIKTMRDHIIEMNPNVQLYINNGEEYIAFRKWSRYQKPSHPQPSILPKPPELQEPAQEPFPERVQEQDQPKTRTSPSQVRSGQDKLGKVRVAQEDFKKYFNSESDLTDFLMTKLTESISAARQAGAHGEQWAIAVLEEFWNQTVGKMSSGIFMGGLDALKKYPIEVVAKAFVKAARYQGGKHQKWKYIQTIIDEEMGKHKEGEK